MIVSNHAPVIEMVGVALSLDKSVSTGHVFVVLIQRIADYPNFQLRPVGYLHSVVD